MAKSYQKMNMGSHSKSSPLRFFSSNNLNFACRSQILIIKDLRQSDAGNYTCELFNSFGTINATYILQVTGNTLISDIFVQFLLISLRRKIAIFR